MARRRRIDDRMLLVEDEVVCARAHQYKIMETVGAGSYAAVYAATDEIGRKVALKEFFPASHPRHAPEVRSLWERERYVLALASRHPLMPSFYEGFAFDERYYLAQEFIEGQNLDDMIASNKKLDNDWMLRWAVYLCDALKYLHERQIVHHDLKPANIKIYDDGRLTLLDFGAARYFGPPDPSLPESMLKEDNLYGTEGYLPRNWTPRLALRPTSAPISLPWVLFSMRW